MMSNETAEIKYIETREDCQRKIDKAQNVCSQCGGKLTPIDTVDNSNRPTFWMGCEPCCRFDYGVKPIVYEIAKKLVLERNYVPYRHMDAPTRDKTEGYKKYWTETQIGGATGLVYDVFLIHKKLTEIL